jgi:chromosome segregation ATPase
VATSVQDVSKLQQQKAKLESQLGHLQAKHDAHVQEAATKAEAAAEVLTEAQRLKTEYASRLEDCQQQFMELESEADEQRRVPDFSRPHSLGPVLSDCYIYTTNVFIT